jgi:ribosomal-protein-alanine N-acetyltransferase
VASEARGSPRPWPAEAYERELTHNRFAHYLAAEVGDPPAMVGFGGLWVQLDELHVSMIAVDPAWRRRGVGAAILVGLLRLGRGLGCRVATLEVRAGNLPAQALYRALGFETVGRRAGYYPGPDPAGPGEDALIMSTPSFDDPGWLRRMAALPPELGWPGEAT